MTAQRQRRPRPTTGGVGQENTTARNEMRIDETEPLEPWAPMTLVMLALHRRAERVMRTKYVATARR